MLPCPAKEYTIDAVIFFIKFNVTSLILYQQNVQAV